MRTYRLRLHAPNSVPFARLPWSFSAAVLFSIATPAPAQTGAGDYATHPVLVSEAGGHQAPVRSILFTGDQPGGWPLLTAGHDKVVREWRPVGSSLAQVKTIRPPRWRGRRGRINAIALSPVPPAGGQRLLAIAGEGIESQGGTIALYRYPGSALNTGELLGFLYEASTVDDRMGHSKTVAALAFHPTKPLLASAGNDGFVLLWDLSDFAPRVIPGREADLSNTDNPEPVARLDHEGGAVQALQFTGDGNRLITGVGTASRRTDAGGREPNPAAFGLIRVYNLAAPNQAPLLSPLRKPGVTAEEAKGLAINPNALAISADDRTLLVGREAGLLDVYQLRPDSLTLSPLSFDQNHIAVEAVACGPRGTTAELLFAVAFAGQAQDPRNTPVKKALSRNPFCTVEIRSLDAPDQVLMRMETVGNLVYALAFSPDGNRLAYSGGDRQSIHVKDLAFAPNRPPDLAAQPTLRAPASGSSIWEIGFLRDTPSISLGYALVRDPIGRPPANYFAFDLTNRHPLPAVDNPATLDRALDSLPGWRLDPIQGVTPHSRRLIGPDGTARLLQVDSGIHGRIWTHTFLPSPDRSRGPALALACDNGILIYSLATAKPTRFLAGHEGSVYCLAPSADGRWLASGSADQTIRLWSLERCDQPPLLGASFEPLKDGTLRVAAVSRHGFAAEAGLKSGMILEVVPSGSTHFVAPSYPKKLPNALPLHSFIAQIDNLPGGSKLKFVYREGEALRTLFTSLQNSPALSFFHEAEGPNWVAWMPQGYYDTSVEGDSRFLGWHLNNASIYRPARTDFVEMKAHEDAFRRIDVLDRLFATNQPNQALDLAELPRQPGEPPAQTDVLATTPPPIQIQADALVDPGPGQAPVVQRVVITPVPDSGEAWASDTIPTELPGDAESGLTVQIDPTLVPRVRDLRAYIGNVAQGDPVVPDANGRAEFKGLKGSGDETVSVEVTSNADVTRRFAFPARFPSSQPVSARLQVLSIGIEKSAHPRARKVDKAALDAEKLAAFFQARLLKPNGDRFDLGEVAEPVILTNATAADIRQQLALLHQGILDRKTQQPLRDDVLAIVLETHLLNPVADGRISPESAVLLGSDGLGPDAKGPLTAYEITESLADIAATGATVLLFLDVVHEHHATSGLGTRATNWVRDLQGGGMVVVLAAGDQPSDFSGDHRNLAGGLLDTELLTVEQDSLSFDVFRKRLTDRVRDLGERDQVPQFYVPRQIADIHIRRLLDTTE